MALLGGCVPVRTCPVAAELPHKLLAQQHLHQPHLATTLPLISAVKIIFMLVQYFLFPNLDGSLSHFSTKKLKHFF